MRLPLLVLLASLAPLIAGAHALGVSHEATTDEGVHVDIGYSSPAPSVGESVIFDFNLPVGEEDERYTDVWVRIEDAAGGVKLATAVYNAEFGGPRMSYAFPEAGEYRIAARYENGSDAVARTEWTITVVPGQGGAPLALAWYAYLVAGLVAGAIIALAAPRLRTLLAKH